MRRCRRSAREMMGRKVNASEGCQATSRQALGIQKDAERFLRVNGDEREGQADVSTWTSIRVDSMF